MEANDQTSSNQEMNHAGPEEGPEKTDELSKLAESVKEPSSDEGPMELDESKEGTNDKDGWLDVLENGDLLKKVIEKGDETCARPERGSRAIINITTRLKGQTDHVIESESGENVEVFIGDADMTHGIDLLLPLMHPGETANVLIGPRFGYGEAGNGKEIPPNSTLDCLVQLKSWVPVDLDEDKIPLEERVRVGGKKKDRGNFWFTRGDWSSAIQCYQSAIKFLTITDEETGGDIRKQLDELKKNTGGDQEEVQMIEKLLHIRATVFNNLAATQLKLEAYSAALKSVDSVLEIEPSNIKALYRKGKILSETGEVDAALNVLNSVLALDKNGENQAEMKIIQKEIAKLSAKQRDQRMKEKEMAKRMFRAIDPPKSGRKSKSSTSTRVLGWGLAATAAVAAASAVAYKFIQ